MSDFKETRRTLKEISFILSVPVNDIPKTLKRMKKELEEN
jgi:hypothetical protein